MTDTQQKLGGSWEGKVRALRIWPGGRKEWRMVNPEDVAANAIAGARQLDKGQFVNFADAEQAAQALILVQMWRESRGELP